MNILILCIFDETDRNKKMQHFHRDNFVKHASIDYYFITYDQNLMEDFKLINDTLLIKGNEHYMNILDKTISSFGYFINKKKYDFVVRTNISTVFNYSLLYTFLQDTPRNNVYTGGLFFKLAWIDEVYGITKANIEKYNLNGLEYFQGTCIILSYDVVKFIMDNSDKLIRDVIDDVSIGLFIKEHLPDAYLTYRNVKYSVIKKGDKIYNINSVLYRHKSCNDDEDIKDMSNTFKIINAIIPSDV
jgi:hypothetical protein